MYLRQFQYLIAIAEERHFGRAAARCNATQPNLSNAIKQLELELGTPIFLRGRGQRVHGLTPEGERVAKWARLIVSHCDAMRDDVRQMRGQLDGDLRIGAMPSMSPVLPIVLQVVRSKYPGVKISVSFVGQDAMKIGLDTFSLDVAFSYADTINARRNMLPVYTENLSLLVPDNEQFRGLTEISWYHAGQLPLGLLKPSTQERTFVDQAFMKAKASPPVPKVESESILHLMFQVQFANLCTIIPSHFRRFPGLHPGTKALKLVEPILSQDVGLFWADTEMAVPMATVMISAIKKLNWTRELRMLLEDHETFDPLLLPMLDTDRDRLKPEHLDDLAENDT